MNPTTFGLKAQGFLIRFLHYVYPNQPFGLGIDRGCTCRVRGLSTDVERRVISTTTRVRVQVTMHCSLFTKSPARFCVGTKVGEGVVLGLSIAV